MALISEQHFHGCIMLATVNNSGISASQSTSQWVVSQWVVAQWVVPLRARHSINQKLHSISSHNTWMETSLHKVKWTQMKDESENVIKQGTKDKHENHNRNRSACFSSVETFNAWVNWRCYMYSVTMSFHHHPSTRFSVNTYLHQHWSFYCRPQCTYLITIKTVDWLTGYWGQHQGRSTPGVSKTLEGQSSPGVGQPPGSVKPSRVNQTPGLVTTLWRYTNMLIIIIITSSGWFPLGLNGKSQYRLANGGGLA